jgi:hypothetical protein
VTGEVWSVLGNGRRPGVGSGNRLGSVLRGGNGGGA